MGLDGLVILEVRKHLWNCFNLIGNPNNAKGKEKLLAFWFGEGYPPPPLLPSLSSFEEIVAANPMIRIIGWPRRGRPRLTLVAPHGHPFSSPFTLVSAVDLINVNQME
jgi:hypothetical protein